MTIEEVISQGVAGALHELYGLDIDAASVSPAPTSKDFEGDLTVVVFPWLKASHKAPQVTAQEIGQWLADHVEAVESFNVVKGFLNITVSPQWWLSVFHGIKADRDFGLTKAGDDSELVMVEYSSPYTWDTCATTCWDIRCPRY